MDSKNQYNTFVKLKSLIEFQNGACYAKILLKFKHLLNILHKVNQKVIL